MISAIFLTVVKIVLNMLNQNNEDKIALPHHQQQSLCTTRLPYRQGRKLTAVKVYSISKESNHLLIFGVPSLNLRQETKALFIKFGKLLQFNISKEHASEAFTETYHAQYERTQSARHAKRMLDTKNFYGGLLHVCYAPELEDANETRQKLIQRQRDVIFRLRNLSKEQINSSTLNEVKATPVAEEFSLRDIENNSIGPTIPTKLNMGNLNTICIGKSIKQSHKHKINDKKVSKTKANKKSCNIGISYNNDTDMKNITIGNNTSSITAGNITKNITDRNITSYNVSYNNETTSNDMNNITIGNNTSSITAGNITKNITHSNITKINYSKDVEVIDCTGVESEVITNINEHLNYKNFGNEIIRKVPAKPVNKIQFHLNKTT